MADRQVVVPGEALAEGPYRLGENVYRGGERIVATRVGLARFYDDVVGVTALHSFYMPSEGDLVIGIVNDVGVSHWLVDVNSPYPATLPASEVFSRPFDPVRDDLLNVLKIGDVVVAKILSFDRTHDPVLTLADGDLGKVTDGVVVYLTPSKIPRLIGRKGSMLNVIQQKTGARMVVGQNGMVLARCDNKRLEDLVIKVINKIEREAHIQGLTNEVTQMLDAELGGGRVE